MAFLVFTSSAFVADGNLQRKFAGKMEEHPDTVFFSSHLPRKAEVYLAQDGYYGSKLGKTGLSWTGDDLLEVLFIRGSLQSMICMS
jgi:hypothetical protein